MGVGGRFDGQTVGAFLTGTHRHHDLEFWRQRALLGRLEHDGRIVRDLEAPVRAGNQVVHVIVDEVEPVVDARIEFLFEDEFLIVVRKPAPLPVHPCGRFNKNSLTRLLQYAFDDLDPRPVHRLDADTTGLLVLAKTRAAAHHLARQFERRTVDKVYLARVHGIAPQRVFSCTESIAHRPGAGGKRHSVADGQISRTDFEVVRTYAEETLVAARLHTGRTNQIRVHLASLGLPIVGDHAYGPAQASEPFISGRSQLLLHAWRMSLCHPQDDRLLELEDELPVWATP